MTRYSPYPYLQVRCRIHNRDFDVSGYVDTGYDGGLVIPESARAGLPSPTREAVVQLADGSHRRKAEYSGTLLFGGDQLQISVLFLGDEYLIGREVVDQLRLCFHHGEYLEIEE